MSVSMPRKIIHLDLDAFFCAVEELSHPSLKGKPFAVGGKPNERGVISSCSYAARQKGVKSAMPSGKAMRLCPELVILPGRYPSYLDMSRQVMDILNEVTPLIEQISIDEAFLDITDMYEPARQVGKIIQQRINQDLGLPCSLGIATSKLVAKIATDFGKSSHHEPLPPNVIFEVLPGIEAQFLAPLPVINLWGIGPKTATLLSKKGIKTIGDIVQVPEKELISLLGKQGYEIHQHAQGIDDRPIVTLHEMKSISQETTFIEDETDLKFLTDTLHQLSNKAGSRLRKANLCCTTVKIKLRWSDFTTLSRQQTVSTPIDEDQVIYNTALKLFEEVFKTPKPVRLIGIGLSNFHDSTYQLDLWQNTTGKGKHLQSAIDELKERFGNQSIQRGYELQRPSRHDET
jgi:DNA polymerase-4